MKEFKKNFFEAIRKNLFFIALLSVVLGLEVFELDYSVYSPGGLINVDERISNREYKSSGSFNMTYVSYRKGSIINLLIAKMLPTYDIIKNEDITLSNEDINDIIPSKVPNFDICCGGFDFCCTSSDLRHCFVCLPSFISTAGAVVTG